MRVMPSIRQRFCKEIILWKQLRHKNLLPFYGAYMTDKFGIISPWLGNGNIVDFTRRNPDVNRLRLVRVVNILRLRIFTSVPL